MNTSDQPSPLVSPVTNALLAGASIVVIISGMRAAASFIVPLLVSASIAIICAPVLNWLRRKGVPLLFALLLVVLGVVIAGALFTLIVGASVNDFVRKLPVYEERLAAQEQELLQWANRVGIPVEHSSGPTEFDPKRLMGLVASLLGGLASIVSNGLLILITTVLLLIEAVDLPAKLKSLPGDVQSRSEAIDRILADIRHYVALKSWVSLLTGIPIAIGLWLIGVDYPLLWGLLAFLLNFVPNIGSIIAGIPPVLLALVQLGPMAAAYAAAVSLLVNLIIGNVVEPRMMGRGLGLSAFVVFFSLIFWGWVLGPVGMLLSVPLTMIMKIVMDRIESLRWAATLLEPGRTS